MGLNFHEDESTFNAAVAESQPPVIQTPVQAGVTIDLTKLLTTGMIGLLICLVIYFLGHQTQTQNHINSSKTLISGKLISKSPASGGAIMLTIYNSDSSREHKVVLTPDMPERFQYTPGSVLQISAQPIGDDIYSCSNVQDIKILTSIRDYYVLHSVNVIRKVATFQRGEQIQTVWVDLPDGYYRWINIALTSDNKVQVLTFNK